MGPLMCVSLSESSGSGWLIKKSKRGAVGNRDFFSSISRLLVPLAGTLPLCHSLLKCRMCVRVNAVRIVVSGADGETGFAYSGWVSGGSESWTL